MGSSALGFELVPHGGEGLIVDLAGYTEYLRGVYPTAIVLVEDECGVLDQVVQAIALSDDLVLAVTLLAAAWCDVDPVTLCGESDMDTNLGGSVLVTPTGEAGKEESGRSDGHLE